MYTSIVNNVSDVNYFSIVDNVSIVKYSDLPIIKKRYWSLVCLKELYKVSESFSNNRKDMMWDWFTWFAIPEQWFTLQLNPSNGWIQVTKIPIFDCVFVYRLCDTIEQNIRMGLLYPPPWLKDRFKVVRYDRRGPCGQYRKHNAETVPIRRTWLVYERW